MNLIVEIFQYLNLSFELSHREKVMFNAAGSGVFNLPRDFSFVFVCLEKVLINLLNEG